MRDISDLIDSKPFWRQCPKCNAWLPSEDALFHHFELVHTSYTPFDDMDKYAEQKKENESVLE